MYYDEKVSHEKSPRSDATTAQELNPQIALVRFLTTKCSKNDRKYTSGGDVSVWRCTKMKHTDRAEQEREREWEWVREAMMERNDDAVSVSSEVFDSAEFSAGTISFLRTLMQKTVVVCQFHKDHWQSLFADSTSTNVSTSQQTYKYKVELRMLCFCKRWRLDFSKGFSLLRYFYTIQTLKTYTKYSQVSSNRFFRWFINTGGIRFVKKVKITMFTEMQLPRIWNGNVYQEW